MQKCFPGAFPSFHPQSAKDTARWSWWRLGSLPVLGFTGLFCSLSATTVQTMAGPRESPSYFSWFSLCRIHVSKCHVSMSPEETSIFFSLCHFLSSEINPFLFYLYKYFACMYISTHTYMYIQVTIIWSLQRSDEGVGYPATGVQTVGSCRVGW